MISQSAFGTLRLSPGPGTTLEIAELGSEDCKVTLRGEKAVSVSIFISGNVEEMAFHHAVLPRMVSKGVAPLLGDWKDGWKSPLCADFHFETEIGAQPYGFFPPFVLLVGGKVRFIGGPTTENRLRISWSWKSTQEGVELTAVFADVAGSDLTGEVSEILYLREWKEPTFELGPEVFESYSQSLDLPSVKPQSLYWGTWNDGTFRNLSQDRILEMARWLKKEAPEVGWVQIDDGWAGPSASVSGSIEDGCATLAMSHFGVFYQEEAHDPRFPEGMKALADHIRAEGLRPMIWLTLNVTADSPLHREKPHWFLPDCRLHFVEDMRFLDVSQPEVQEYVRGALKKIFVEWGFEGCKLDFWTMPFEQPDAKAALSSSLVEGMSWFCTELRKVLPEDGLLMHCIDLPFGSPFRAKFFDEFRLYSDSEGICRSEEMMREQARWTSVLVGLYGVQRWWIPNGDGLGVFDHFNMPESHFRRWVTLLLASGTLCELAGWLYQKGENPRVETIRRLLPYAAHGKNVTLPGYDWASMSPDGAPTVWLRHDSESEKLVGLTNWSDAAHSVTLAQLGLSAEFDMTDLLGSRNVCNEIEVAPFDGVLIKAVRR